MEYNGLPCDSLSSLYIPFGYAIDLYDYDSWGGGVRTYVGKPYIDSNKQMECTNMGDWDNMTCSAKVYKTRQLGAAQGYW